MRSTVSDRVLRQIQEEIECGTLSPGDRIDEQMLSTRFEVSRTPAREALLRLAASGAVRMVPRRGAVVAGVSPSLAVGMVEVLAALEAEAAGLAARRMRPAHRARLAELHQAAGGAVERLDIDGYITGNAAFHAVIHEGAGNAFLAQQIAVVRQRMRFYHRSSLEQPARVRASWREHAQVAASIADGDETAAQAAMRQHILFGGKVFSDMLASLNLEDVVA